jgi:SSS family solute:Na+ symporter
MLTVGYFRPQTQKATGAFAEGKSTAVDMTPWHYAKTCAISLFSCVVFLYLLFSPVGVAGDSATLFILLSCLLVTLNVAAWYKAFKRDDSPRMVH